MKRKLIKGTELYWDARIVEHIAKHNVTKVEIEEVLFQKVKTEKSYKGRFVVFGKTVLGRTLAIAMKKTNKGYYIFSARDADKKERRVL